MEKSGKDDEERAYDMPGTGVAPQSQSFTSQARPTGRSVNWLVSHWPTDSNAVHPRQILVAPIDEVQRRMIGWAVRQVLIVFSLQSLFSSL